MSEVVSLARAIGAAQVSRQVDKQMDAKIRFAFWFFIEKHLLNRSTHSNELRGAKGDTQIEKILKFIFVECLRQFLVLHHRINNM